MLDPTLMAGQVNRGSTEESNTPNISITTEQNKATKPKKKKNKKAVDRSQITPEYIEQQRAIRNQRKLERQKELETQQALQKEKGEFIKREFLQIPGQLNRDDQFSLKIMSYNMLAQGLVRRTLFPSSGGALKWEWRSSVLLDEIKHYNPDILCLQELDNLQFKTFWKAAFQNLGYTSNFYSSSTKTHGVCIVYKKEYFTCPHQSFINYDQEINMETVIPRARTSTGNIGLISYLEFKQEVRDKYPYLTKNGVLIGTTHLFWHPFGTYERTRQTYLLMYKFQSFVKVLETIVSKAGFYSFFAGDMNSQPYDSPYLSMTSKPVEYSGRAETVLTYSLSHDFTRKKAKTQKDVEEVDEKESCEPILKKNTTEEKTKDVEVKSRIPVPEEHEPTEEELALARELRDLHNSVPTRAISLYSVGYKKVHPENSGIDNIKDEPLFSNWAHSWRGLLDYIFVLTDWNLQDDFSKVDSIADLETNQCVKLTKLLRLPSAEEMGPEPSGQPRMGQYPSDHLCIMAEVVLL